MRGKINFQMTTGPFQVAFHQNSIFNGGYRSLCIFGQPNLEVVLGVATLALNGDDDAKVCSGALC